MSTRSFLEDVGAAVAPMVGIIASTYFPGDAGVKAAVGGAMSALLFALMRALSSGHLRMPTWMQSWWPFGHGKMIVVGDDLFSDFSAFLLQCHVDQFDSMGCNRKGSSAVCVSLSAAQPRGGKIYTHWGGHAIFVEIVNRSQVKSDMVVPNPHSLQEHRNWPSSSDMLLQTIKNTHQIRVYSHTAPTSVLLDYVKRCVSMNTQSQYNLQVARHVLSISPDGCVAKTVEWQKQLVSENEPAWQSLLMEISAAHAELYNEIVAFLNRADWYKRVGQCFRRTVLLHGAPGSGKTTFIRLLAARHKLPLMCLDLGIIEEVSQLAYLISKVPSGTEHILLLDDLDKFIVRMKDDRTSAQLISILLSALDGPLSGIGRLTFMTCNTPEVIMNLDPSGALTRAGRIDMIVRFSHASTTFIRQLLRQCLDETDEAGLADLDDAELPTNMSVAEVMAIVQKPNMTVKKALSELNRTS